MLVKLMGSSTQRVIDAVVLTDCGRRSYSSLRGPYRLCRFNDSDDDANVRQLCLNEVGADRDRR